MPIVGLTTRDVNLKDLPIIARLYKGAERTQEDIAKKRPAKELPHFRIKFEPEFAHLVPLWNALYGDEPSELQGVMLGANTADEAFTAFYREWGKTGIIRECTGEKITRVRDADLGRVIRVENVSCARLCGQECDCKQEGTLDLILPALLESAGVLGKVRLVTHSIEDIRTIHSVLAVTEAIYGDLGRVPFILYRKYDEVAFLDKKDNTRKTMKKWFVKIRVEEEFVRQSIARRLSTGAPMSTPMLPDGEFLPSATPALAQKTWIATNGNADKILAWAKGWFKMEAQHVLEAFQSDEPSVQEIADYTGDADRVYACIIAYYSGGEVSKVFKVCGHAQTVPPERAQKITRLVQEILANWASAYEGEIIEDETA